MKNKVIRFFKIFCIDVGWRKAFLHSIDNPKWEASNNVKQVANSWRPALYTAVSRHVLGASTSDLKMKVKIFFPKAFPHTPKQIQNLLDHSL